MRIVTRPDLDGVVCAVLLYEVEDITRPILWLEPGEVQKGGTDINSEDILSNLPYDARCAMWFDHHFSNKTDQPFKSAFRIAPSAARIIFDHYADRYKRDYRELVAETDKIDSADFTKDEVLHPENSPHILLSMTISGRPDREAAYWEKLVRLLKAGEIGSAMADKEVKARCNRVIEENALYEGLLGKHTRVDRMLSVTDFRSLNHTPRGNRFLVYSLYPGTNVNAGILFNEADRERVMVKVGHSIFNKTCKVNVGKMLAAFGGGGHRGAGSCSFPRHDAESSISTILDILRKNEPNE